MTSSLVSAVCPCRRPSLLMRACVCTASRITCANRVMLSPNDAQPLLVLSRQAPLMVTQVLALIVVVVLELGLELELVLVPVPVPVPVPVRAAESQAQARARRLSVLCKELQKHGPGRDHARMMMRTLAL